MSSSPIQNEFPAHAATSPEGGATEKLSNGRARKWYQSRSLRAKLRVFFAENPAIELSRGEIAAKFFRSLKTVDVALACMRADGELESVHAWRLPSKARQ